MKRLAWQQRRTGGESVRGARSGAAECLSPLLEGRGGEGGREKGSDPRGRTGEGEAPGPSESRPAGGEGASLCPRTHPLAARQAGLSWRAKFPPPLLSLWGGRCLRRNASVGRAGGGEEAPESDPQVLAAACGCAA